METTRRKSSQLAVFVSSPHCCCCSCVWRVSLHDHQKTILCTESVYRKRKIKYDTRRHESGRECDHERHKEVGPASEVTSQSNFFLLLLLLFRASSASLVKPFILHFASPYSFWCFLSLLLPLLSMKGLWWNFSFVFLFFLMQSFSPFAFPLSSVSVSLLSISHAVFLATSFLSLSYSSKTSMPINPSPSPLLLHPPWRLRLQSYGARWIRDESSTWGRDESFCSFIATFLSFFCSNLPHPTFELWLHFLPRAKWQYDLLVLQSFLCLFLSTQYTVYNMHRLAILHPSILCPHPFQVTQGIVISLETPVTIQMNFAHCSSKGNLVI